MIKRFNLWRRLAWHRGGYLYLLHENVRDLFNNKRLEQILERLDYEWDVDGPTQTYYYEKE